IAAQFFTSQIDIRAYIRTFARKPVICTKRAERRARQNTPRKPFDAAPRRQQKPAQNNAAVIDQRRERGAFKTTIGDFGRTEQSAEVEEDGGGENNAG